MIFAIALVIVVLTICDTMPELFDRHRLMETLGNPEGTRWDMVRSVEPNTQNTYRRGVIATVLSICMLGILIVRVAYAYYQEESNRNSED
jgi:hypothetical protein